ncbi:MAG: hypothetical protein AAGA89_03165 [Pseudomonadota bacterium]
MQWLIANMWIAMAAATVLGLLFGFALRGLMVGSRIRKAEVEREIAKTELTQSKAEVEALYAAQRKQKEETAAAPGGGDVLVAALDEREKRITALGEELSTARAELEALQASKSENSHVLETAGAAVAGAVAGAVLSDSDQEELTRLRDRNAWLEERVAGLESDIAAAPSVAVSDATPVVAEAESAPESSVADEKTRWQAAYLRTRVDALEAKLVAQSAAVLATEAAPVEDAVTAPDPEPAAEAPNGSDMDEELAQLRWRNRYLEGRLAYFEQAPDEDTADPEPAGTDSEDASESIEEPPEEVKPVSEDAEQAAEPEPEQSDEAVVIEPVAAEAEPEIHPSEAMLAELDGKQPVQLERPSDGGDDLTTITGIGPRIAEVLNGLGIWTFGQIAEWKPENQTWIENHLSFKGRVSRENWVEQARELLVSA